MYDHEWRRYSCGRLSLFPYCARCERLGRARLAIVTDHITPHRGDPAIFWDVDNHQSLCKKCHDQKTRNEDGGGGRAPSIGQPARRASYDNPNGEQVRANAKPHVGRSKTSPHEHPSKRGRLAGRGAG